MSEDASIEVFRPHHAQTASDDAPLVWAVDTRHLPLFWFPRGCPRATFWADSRTSDSDVQRFLSGSRDRRVHAIECGWLRQMRSARVVAYRLPEDPFEAHARVGGYWVSREPLEPVETIELGDLVERHAEALIELRIIPNLWPLWDAVVASTLEFSGVRLRNALPRTSDAGSGTARGE